MTVGSAFASSVREQRQQVGMSQERLAELAGIGDATAIVRIENGQRSVKLGEAVSIAAALGVPLTAMIEGETEEADAVRRRQSADREKLTGLLAAALTLARHLDEPQ